MGIEIERKFLVRGDAWRGAARSTHRMVQGYLGGERCSTRVRVEGERAWINVKSLHQGPSRSEYEFAIPAADALQMLGEFCDQRVDKVRHEVAHGAHLWEVDEFLGENAGLIVAEVELQQADEAFERPEWLGEEVTDEVRYYNVRLVREPFSRWPDREAIVRGIAACS